MGALAAKPGASQEPASAVSVDARTEYYSVPGETLADVVAQLNTLRLEGPDAPPSQGLTRYHILPEWRAVASGGACRVADLRVQVRIVVTLPRWPGVDRRPDEEQARWEVISDAIRDHEEQHRALVEAAAVDLAASLASLESRGCTNLGWAVESALSVADGRLKEAHAEFDRATPSRLSTRPGDG